MYLKKILIMVMALTMICLMSPVVAQDEEKNDGLARVVLITAKDGQNKALEEAITKYHHYMAGHKGSWRYSWYSIETGRNTGKYLARSGGHNWADFDAEHDWDGDAAEKFQTMVAPYIDIAEIKITKNDDEVGMWPESLDGYEYYSVTNWYVKQGHYAAFSKGLKKVNELLNDGGWPNYYAFVNTVSGGKNGELALVSPRKNFADMAAKEPSFIDIMNKAMGEEETQAFLSEWSKTYHTGSNQLLRYRPKLSDYGE